MIKMMDLRIKVHVFVIEVRELGRTVMNSHCFHVRRGHGVRARMVSTMVYRMVVTDVHVVATMSDAKNQQMMDLKAP